MSQGTILLIDEDRELLAAMSKYLERRGYDVAEASSVRTVFAQLAEGAAARIELVIVEQSIAQHEHGRVMRAVRRLCPHTPIIIVTGSANAVDLEEVRALGGDGLLHKPLDGDSLIQTIREVGASTPAAASPVVVV